VGTVLQNYDKLQDHNVRRSKYSAFDGKGSIAYVKRETGVTNLKCTHRYK